MVRNTILEISDSDPACTTTCTFGRSYKLHLAVAFSNRGSEGPKMVVVFDNWLPSSRCTTVLLSRLRVICLRVNNVDA